MLRKVTIVAYGNAFLQDKAGLEALNDGQEFTSRNLKAGDTVELVLTEGQWDRVRSQLVKASQMRLPVAGSRSTQPLLTYTVEYLPGARARLSQVEGALSLAGAAQQLVLRGENLIPGVAASAVHGAGTAKLTLSAARKGPLGNLVDVEIKAASGAGSVTTVHGKDGAVKITVVPAAAGPGANAVAAQIAADTHAAAHLVGVGGGTGTVAPTKLRLAGGDGSGVAWLELDATSGGTGRLVLEARKPGNGGNLITLRVRLGQGANAVSVSGTDITVDRTEASAVTLANLETALDGNASAAALAVASVVGAGSVGAVEKTWLYGGSGEDVSAKIGGAAATVVSNTDAALTLEVTGAALVTAGGVAGEQAVISVLTGHGALQAQVTLAA